jgi:phosphomannomutase
LRGAKSKRQRRPGSEGPPSNPLNKPIISISGIRGVFGKSLTPEIILKYTSAFARYIGKKRVVVGRDGRLCGDLVENLIIFALSFSGCEVIALGIAPTPTIALAVRTLKANGGISVTASHNPQEWNGMKFIDSRGVVLDATRITSLKHIRRMTDKFDINLIEYYPDFANFHISKILNSKFVNVQQIRKRKFKVVLDCVNASGSLILPTLLKKLGCKVIKIDCDGSGIFTRNPEPLPHNIKRTCALVKSSKADVGIVVDPDADRLVIITEQGKPFGEEYTITTAIAHVFKQISKSKRIAAVNLSTTRAVDDIAKKYQGNIYRSPVGELNVIKKMKQYNAVIGGEGSGGVILPSVNFCRDSLAGIGLLLGEFSESELSVSEYKESLPQYFIVKDKIQLTKINPNKVINALSKMYKKYKQNRKDGLRINFPDSWINFRKSNTEPIIRIIAEAKTKKLAEDLLHRFKKSLIQ